VIREYDSRQRITAWTPHGETVRSHSVTKEITAMRPIAERMWCLLNSEDGPTAVEYAVMLAVIVVVCWTAIQSIGTNTNTTFNNMAPNLGS
jgi:pilus assembly protein Flp/PilA